MSNTELQDRIVPPKAVMLRTSLSRTTLWRLARKGTFPAPIQLSENRIGWSEKAINEWVASRTVQATAA